MHSIAASMLAGLDHLSCSHGGVLRGAYVRVSVCMFGFVVCTLALSGSCLGLSPIWSLPVRHPYHLNLSNPYQLSSLIQATIMVRFLQLLSTLTVLLGVASTVVVGQASNDDPQGKVLYVNYPSCSYYRCQVTWRQNEAVYINWLNAPRGGLRIQLTPQDGTTGLQTYTITDNVGSIHGFSQHKCNDMGTGEKCGRFDWTVPPSVKPGEYMVVVSSLAKPQYVGYTDTVVVQKAKSKKSSSKTRALHRLDSQE